MIVEESHPDDLMGIYDPVGGLQRIVIFRDANPNAEEVRRDGLARGRPPPRAWTRTSSTELGYALTTTWEPVIGLEIHVQLSTRTKMFCGCELSFGDEPNIHTCPICLAHPGTLPVAERAGDRATRSRSALALGCEIAPRSIFHRKNYFYPDNPKAYQISQYDFPLATGGRLGDVRIHRVHLEEDAAKLVHDSASGRIHGSGASLVDFNRGGTPLVEIVTEPDLHDAATAREWLQLLRTTIRQLGVSDVNMEEGSLRCDANVSLRPAGSEELGTKTELKNMNSFRFLERGIEAEIERQAAILDGGGRGRAGDAALRPAHRRADPAALEGVLARLPLLPRARPGAAGADRGDDRGGARRRCPSCPPSAASATRPSSAWARSRRPSSPSTPSSAPTSSAVLAAAAGARRGGRRQLGHRRAHRGAPRGRRRRSQRPRPETPRRDDRDGRRRSGSRTRAGAPGPARRWSPRAATRPRSPSARVSGRSRTRASSRRSSPGDRGRPRGRRAGARGQHEGDRAARRLRDARDQGPRRRRRGHPADPREARALVTRASTL